MAEKPNVKMYDGVAVIARGDLILIVYQQPARLHRTRWLFDMLDGAAAANLDGIKGLMVVLPTADPPDAPTRAENTARFRKLAPSMKLMVTVPVGDALWVSLVRTVMRAIHVIQGRSRNQAVLTTLEAGVERLLEAAGPKTPPRTQIEADLDALHQALGVEAPWAVQRKAS
jgi:hypothetical protein